MGRFWRAQWLAAGKLHYAMEELVNEGCRTNVLMRSHLVGENVITDITDLGVFASATSGLLEDVKIWLDGITKHLKVKTIDGVEPLGSVQVKFPEVVKASLLS